MTKIRVLGLPSDLFGVGHYRIIWPLLSLQKNHGDEFDIELRTPGHPVRNEDLSKFDVVHFHRRLGEQEQTIEWMRKFDAAGVVVILDIDDYWTPFSGHPVEILAKNAKLDEVIKSCIRRAPHVTTTTSIFADLIRPMNKHVHVVVNALDMKQPQWRYNLKPSNRVRVGWIGGSSHERDLKLINGVFHKLYDDEELKGKFEISMCGFDIRGSVTEINPITKEQHTKPLNPKDSIWYKFEDIFSGGRGQNNPYYNRYNTLPITRYGQHYNNVDVCLAPIDRNMFNKAKSELKIVESGMMKKTLIVSDLYIFNKLLTHLENAWLISPNNDIDEWVIAIKYVILSSELRDKLSSELHTLVKDKYELTNAVLERANLYRKLVEEKRNVKGSSTVQIVR